MRLDKMLSECGIASRRESAKAIKAGQVTVNGIPAKKPEQQVDPERDRVCFCGREIRYRK